MVTKSFFEPLEIQPKATLLPDLRIYNHFYSQWWTVSPVENVKVDQRMNTEVDVMTITLPCPHSLDSMLQGTRVKGAPVSLEINGVYWTGQVATAVKKSDENRTMWNITVESDHKHLHRLQSRTPVTEHTSPTVSFKGTLGKVMRYLASQAVMRTGLPMYLTGDGEGPEVELALQVDKTIAEVLGPAIDASEMMLDVQAVHPIRWSEAPNPGGKRAYLYAGALEYTWFEEAKKQGVYSDVPVSDKITAAPVGDPYTPHNARRIVKDTTIPAETLDIDGSQQTNATGDISWVPFWIDIMRLPKPSNATDSQWENTKNQYLQNVHVIQNQTRVTTREKIKQMVGSDERLQWLGAHATYWAPAQYRNYNFFGSAVFYAAFLRRIALVKNGVPTLMNPEAESVSSYVGDFGRNPKMWAWWDGYYWVVATDSELTRYYQKHSKKTRRDVMPGVMMRLVQPRDRTQKIVFNTADKSLPQWSATINAPEAASMILGTQMDMFRAGLAQGALSDRAIFGIVGQLTPEQAKQKLPTAAKSIHDLGAVAKGFTVNSLPASRVEGTNLSYDTLTAVVDMGVVGPLFYRESFHAGGNGEWTSDATTALEKAWSDMQGSIALSLTPSTSRYVFGNDVQVFPGRVIPGWKPGDRVTFIDGDTTVTELITGWEAEWSSDQPVPRVSPILGKPQAQQTPIDDFVDVVRKVEKLAGSTSLSANGTPPPVELVDYKDIGRFGVN